MIITHASADKIETIETDSFGVRQGCLFFGGEDNSYNLLGECNYKYNLNVDSVIETSRFFFDHEASEIQSVLDDMMIELDVTEEEACELLDETTQADDAEASWAVQQYQGRAADALGYDAAESFDEQGVVYIAYCANKKLKLV